MIDYDDNKLIDEFIGEALELLLHAGRDALTLKQNWHDWERIDRIYRAFQTIKENAGFLDFYYLSGFVHKSGNLLSGIREGELKINRELRDVILQIINRMMNMVVDPQNSEDVQTTDLENTIAALLEARLEKAEYLVN
jgi:chemotaxis protein histidine kinase CheA